MASDDSKTLDDRGISAETPLANQIRLRVKALCEAGYSGAAAITRHLLEHWTAPKEFESRRLFFCQFEAAETLFQAVEAHDGGNAGLEIPIDDGEFRRPCDKMAAGTGKTVGTGGNSPAARQNGRC